MSPQFASPPNSDAHSFSSSSISSASHRRLNAFVCHLAAEESSPMDSLSASPTAARADSDWSSQYQNFEAGSGRSDRNRQYAKLVIYAAKAVVAGDSVIEKQKDQLIQLIQILKQIESQVNNRQSHMVETLANRRHSLRKFFQRAIAYLSTVDRVDHRGFQVAVIHSCPPTVCINARVRNTTTKPLRAAASAPQKYVYPDPIPEFAESETHKFRAELSRKLLKDNATFGDDFSSVIDVCAEIFSEFLLKEYGGPGTLKVDLTLFMVKF